MRDALEEVMAALEVAPLLDPEVDEDFDPCPLLLILYYKNSKFGERRRWYGGERWKMAPRGTRDYKSSGAFVVIC